MLEIPKAPTEFTVPPFDELTMIIFGIPGSGKTRFTAGCKDTIFFSTEPGQECLKARVMTIKSWDDFRQHCQAVAQAKDSGRDDISTVVIDIIDNLYLFCRDWVCQQKGTAYPSDKDFGRTWSEITQEWTNWMRALLHVVNVRFISHTATRIMEVTNQHGIKEEVDVFMPTFSSNKSAQYLDGVVSAMGFMLKNKLGQHCITFRQTATIGAKDRTDILAKLGDIVLPTDPDKGWAYVSAYYAKACEEMGLKIKSRR